MSGQTKVIYAAPVELEDVLGPLCVRMGEMRNGAVMLLTREEYRAVRAMVPIYVPYVPEETPREGWDG